MPPTAAVRTASGIERRHQCSGHLNAIGAGDLEFGSNTSTSGQGTTERVPRSLSFGSRRSSPVYLPNGNLVISGSQEVRVNQELRILNVAGIVRPLDVDHNNTVAYDKIAEARVSYGGRGRLTEVQQPPYGAAARRHLVADLTGGTMADTEEQEEGQGKKKSGLIVTIAIVLVLSGVAGGGGWVVGGIIAPQVAVEDDAAGAGCPRQGRKGR
jgi:hypothetical protein